LGVDSPLDEREQSDDHGDRTGDEEDLVPAALVGNDRWERDRRRCGDVHNALFSTISIRVEYRGSFHAGLRADPG